jgi:hypothetical protein
LLNDRSMTGSVSSPTSSGALCHPPACAKAAPRRRATLRGRQLARWYGALAELSFTMTRVARRRAGAMADPEIQTEAWFGAIVEALAGTPGVTHSKCRGRLFGASALKVHDKIFAMVSSGGEFVVKLPKARVDALAASGVGAHFDANRGRPMKEWLEVRSESARMARTRARGA